MIDLEKLRRQPKLFRRAIELKGVPLDLDELLKVDEQRRKLMGFVDDARHRRNLVSELVKSGGDNREQHIADSRTIGKELTVLEHDLDAIEKRFNELTALVPGIPCEDVPPGKTDEDNVEIKRIGEIHARDFQMRDHLELAQMHGMLDLEGARNVAGSRAYALTGEGALLELAVLRFAFDFVLAKGFTPVLPPLMVKAEAMFGTGYFPLGEDDAYVLERDGIYLTGTSEVGIAAMQMNRVFDRGELPLRFVGISTCFRREAGAAGRDTRGLYRVHQFQKVEQVVICENDDDVSARHHELLLQNSEEILQALELPYRVVAVCAGDMGLGQVRKHDIETWMPSREKYGETHSCSTFHDFQARRLHIRYRDGQTKYFAHTLNNTAIASPRILIALLENHQNADGTINVPKALRPYLDGKHNLPGLVLE